MNTWYYTSFWVGMDGYNWSKAMLQAGIDIQVLDQADGLQQIITRTLLRSSPFRSLAYGSRSVITSVGPMVAQCRDRPRLRVLVWLHRPDQRHCDEPLERRGIFQRPVHRYVDLLCVHGTVSRNRPAERGMDRRGLRGRGRRADSSRQLRYRRLHQHLGRRQPWQVRERIERRRSQYTAERYDSDPHDLGGEKGHRPVCVRGVQVNMYKGS